MKTDGKKDRSPSKEKKKETNENIKVIFEQTQEEEQFEFPQNAHMSEEERLRRREELDKIKIRKTQANTFEKYLNETGISAAFQLIFSELITKKINPENYYSYTAGRLRQIGREMEDIKLKNSK